MKTPIVIRLSPLDGLWYICHANSYQNAFRAAYNGYRTRSEAEIFALSRECAVELHPADALQQCAGAQP